MLCTNGMVGRFFKFFSVSLNIYLYLQNRGKRLRSNLVMKVNFRGSFEIDSKTGVTMAEL